MRFQKRNLIVVDFGFKTGRVFGAMFPSSAIYRSPSQLNEDSVVLFEGGTDISPELYGEERCSWTHQPHIARDNTEVAIFHQAQKKGAAFIGICRGAQLLTVLSGGKLFQDVSGHGDAHLMLTGDGRTIATTSLHHQMMNPFVLPDDAYKLIAWSKEPKSHYYIGANDQTDFLPDKEPEVVWYPKTKSLCIQGHPEFADPKCKFVKYCQELVHEYIFSTAEK